MKIIIFSKERGLALSLRTQDDWYNVIVLDAEELYRLVDEEALSITAHEIAHIYLGHPRDEAKPYNVKQDEANALIQKWGFRAVED